MKTQKKSTIGGKTEDTIERGGRSKYYYVADNPPAPWSFQELRNSLGLSQREAAELLELSIWAIQKMESREKSCLNTRKFPPGNRRNYLKLEKAIQINAVI